MKQTITSDKQTVEEALKNRIYFVDFYQREYMWNRETVEILLRDIFYSFDLSYQQYSDAELTPESDETQLPPYRKRTYQPLHPFLRITSSAK